MVECHKQQTRIHIVLRPNCSADWQSNRRILLFIALANTLFASGFIAIGAWMILPFMGLELLLLWWLLRRVFQQLQFKQVIRLDSDRLTIENGFIYPLQKWDWPRECASVLVRSKPHPLEPFKISLNHQGQEVALGEFLNQEDRQNLLNSLQKAGLSIRQFSHDGDLLA